MALFIRTWARATPDPSEFFAKSEKFAKKASRPPAPDREARLAPPGLEFAAPRGGKFKAPRTKSSRSSRIFHRKIREKTPRFLRRIRGKFANFREIREKPFTGFFAISEALGLANHIKL